MPVKWVLEGYFGNNQETLQHIPLSQLPFKIGRETGVNLTIVRPNISRLHAEFFESDGKLMLRDCNSTNGTFVNETRLDKNQSVPLQLDDEVRFGDWYFHLKQPPT